MEFIIIVGLVAFWATLITIDLVLQHPPKDFKRMSLAEKSRKDLLKSRQKALSITTPSQSPETKLE